MEAQKYFSNLLTTTAAVMGLVNWFAQAPVLTTVAFFLVAIALFKMSPPPPPLLPASRSAGRALTS